MGRVLVAGSLIMDVVATAPRHPRVGETVLGHGMFFFPGGKGANQALAAARLGAPAQLIGRVGRDRFGSELKAFLAEGGVDLRHVGETETAATGSAVIVVAQEDNAIVVVAAANAELDSEHVRRVELNPDDVVLAQFEIPLGTVEVLLRRGRSIGARTILNPAPALAEGRPLLALADMLILNESELTAFAGITVDVTAPVAEVARAARALRSQDGQVVCVTLGARGAVAVDRDDIHVVEGRPVPVTDTTGAGDCFAGAVAADLARGRPLREALAFANAAASVCVQRMGAGPSMPTRDEVPD